MATSEVRTLTIKTGSVKRLAKELVMYREEENREQTKLEKMKAENADPYDIKHAENVLSESLAMVRDTYQRLKTAIKDLEEFMEENADALPTESTEYTAAKEELNKAVALV